MRCCMRAFRRSRTTRQASALAASLLAGGLMVAAGAGPAAAGPAAGLKQVLYQGYTFDVPASWPVIDEALHPHTCVRFDQHAVYLGGPGPDQSCPSWLFGTTESVVIQTGPAVGPALRDGEPGVAPDHGDRAAGPDQRDLRPRP